MNTFKRYEKKYILSKQQKEELVERIKEHMSLDPYCLQHEHYLIRNIYYDTSNNDLIHMSVNKPIFKEKIRVRKYGTYHDERDEYFLEIKRKYDSIVYKRRVTLTKEQLDSFMESKKAPKFNTFFDQQVGKEIEYLFQAYKVEPKVFISYVRIAYFDKQDPSFRLTFDNQIHTRRKNLDFDLEDYEKDLLPKDTYLMEVKAGVSFPLWFARALSDLKIYPASFSKYGQEYKVLMEENKLCY